MAPAPVVEPTTGAQNLRLLKGLILPIMVVVFVLRSIRAGIASVTEASAVGVAGVALSAVIRGGFSWILLRESAIQTLATCGMIVRIGIGATALVGICNLTGGVRFVGGPLTGTLDDPA